MIEDRTASARLSLSSLKKCGLILYSLLTSFLGLNLIASCLYFPELLHDIVNVCRRNPPAIRKIIQFREII